MTIEIIIDGESVARAVVDHLPHPIEYKALERISEEFRKSAITVETAFRRIADVLRSTEARRRRRAKYEIREAIAARRIGVAPKPWRARS